MQSSCSLHSGSAVREYQTVGVSTKHIVSVRCLNIVGIGCIRYVQKFELFSNANYEKRWSSMTCFCLGAMTQSGLFLRILQVLENLLENSIPYLKYGNKKYRAVHV
ncbi:uncharacterized protein LOC131237240 isoform X2 [Magnolia sinica]|uniref:uncharacterized protein LOC131237240 isoform X2 n=1 Tax=Magnolia sinica TaxID=86752 RepID=UPI00265AF3F7|nr:uncharacterized protein LOC131237240 isoform X2 [Magnolia sinica]